MNSFGYGNRSVNASSIEEGLAIVKALDELDYKANQREMLRKIKHGHSFRYRKCACGLLEKDYIYNIYEYNNYTDICPKNKSI